MQRVALVTGGSHRLGAVLCRTLAARGWRVVIHCRSGGPDADALANEIGGIVLPYDLAGDTPERIVSMASADKMEALWRVNLRAPMLLSAAFAAQAQGPDRSAIVHILDQKIANPNPDFPSYTASKAGLAGMVAPMAMGYRAQCRVIGVAPGILFPSYDQTDDEFQAVAAGNLIGRPIDAGHVAQTVAFVLDCPAITGQILYADNGQHLERSARDIMFLGREGA